MTWDDIIVKLSYLDKESLIAIILNMANNSPYNASIDNPATVAKVIEDEIKNAASM